MGAIRSVLFSAVAAAALTVTAASAKAATITFDFNSLSIGTGTPITETVGGLSVTFSAAGDPGAFQVNSSFFSFPGNVLYTPGVFGQQNQALVASFSAPINSFSAPFATNGAGPLDLTAWSGGSKVGEISAYGIAPSGYSFPEGVITFGGTSFDTVVLADHYDSDFAVGTMSVSPVPLPAALPMFGAAIAGLAGFGLKRKQGAT